MNSNRANHSILRFVKRNAPRAARVWHLWAYIALCVALFVAWLVFDFVPAFALAAVLSFIGIVFFAVIVVMVKFIGVVEYDYWAPRARKESDDPFENLDNRSHYADKPKLESLTDWKMPFR